MVLLPLLNTYQIPLWGGSKSEFKMQLSQLIKKKITDRITHLWEQVHKVGGLKCATAWEQV